MSVRFSCNIYQRNRPSRPSLYWKSFVILLCCLQKWTQGTMPQTCNVTLCMSPCIVGYEYLPVEVAYCFPHKINGIFRHTVQELTDGLTGW